MRVNIYLLLVFIVILSAGIFFVGIEVGRRLLSTKPAAQSQIELPIDIKISPMPKFTYGHPKLDDALNQLLISSEDYEVFTQTHGLEIKDNKVLVEIHLNEENYSLPDNFGEENTRFENLLDAWVYIDKLIELADNNNISFIKSPTKVVPLD